MSLLRSLMSRSRIGARPRPTPVRTSAAAIPVVQIETPPPAPVDVGLVPRLVAHDVTPENDRMDTQAESGLIHVSSLPDLCPRAITLAQEYGNLDTLLKRVSSNDRIVWDMGRATERLVRDRIIESIGVRNVIGKWMCPCEGEEVYYADEEHELPLGHHYLPCGCGRKQVSVYHEIPLLDTEAGIIGNCDLPYYNDRGEVVVTEIKSAKGEFFQQMPVNFEAMPTTYLRQTASSHKFQATAYHRLLSGLGYPMANYVRILYVSKNYIRDVPYKEYVVPITPEITSRLDIEWDKARLIKQARTTGTLPPKLPICNAVSVPRAKGCPLVVACFSTRR